MGSRPPAHPYPSVDVRPGLKYYTVFALFAFSTDQGRNVFKTPKEQGNVPCDPVQQAQMLYTNTKLHFYQSSYVFTHFIHVLTHDTHTCTDVFGESKGLKSVACVFCFYSTRPQSRLILLSSQTRQAHIISHKLSSLPSLTKITCTTRILLHSLVFVT